MRKVPGRKEMSLADVKLRIHEGLEALGCSPPTEEQPNAGLFFPFGYLLAEELYGKAGEIPRVKAIHNPASGMPVSPAVGDRYIASQSAGGWIKGNIYEWLGSGPGWSTVPYRVGSIVFVVAEDDWYGAGNDSWVPIGTGAEFGGTVQQYVRGDGSLGNFNQTARWALDGVGPIDYDPALGRIGFDAGWADARYVGVADARIAQWNAAYSHVFDAVVHITAGERAIWNAKEDAISPGTANQYYSWNKTWKQVQWSELGGVPSSFTPANHALIGSHHTVSGLTAGHVLRASGATAYGFAQLTTSDVTEGSRLYYTDARVQMLGDGRYARYNTDNGYDTLAFGGVRLGQTNPSNILWLRNTVGNSLQFGVSNIYCTTAYVTNINTIPVANIYHSDNFAPGNLTATTTNQSSGGTHTHAVTGFLPLTGGVITGPLQIGGGLGDGIFITGATITGTSYAPLRLPNTELGYVTFETDTQRLAFKNYLGYTPGDIGAQPALGYTPTRAALSANNQNSVYIDDTRDNNFAPQDRLRGVYFDFRANSAGSALSDGGSFHTNITVRPWGGTPTDFSGGTVKQLALTDNGNLWIRQSTSATAWSTWQRFYHTGSKPTAADVGALSSSDSRITGWDDVVARGIRRRLGRVHSVDGTSLNDSNTWVAHGFDYNTAGANITGPYLSFGDLNGNLNYQCQIVAAYSTTTGQTLRYRTRNGDSQTWNDWRSIYHSGWTTAEPTFGALGLGTAPVSGFPLAVQSLLISPTVIRRTVNNDGVLISGGDGTAAGGNIGIYGGSSVVPNTIVLRAGSAERLIINNTGTGVNTVPESGIAFKVGGVTQCTALHLQNSSNQVNNVNGYLNFISAGIDAMYMQDGDVQIRNGLKVGINANITFIEVREMTGSTHPTNVDTSINLPSGFTTSNTRLLSFEIQDGQSNWLSLLQSDSSNTFNVQLNSSNKLVIAAIGSTYKGKNFRAVLARV